MLSAGKDWDEKAVEQDWCKPSGHDLQGNWMLVHPHVHISKCTRLNAGAHKCVIY